MNKDVATTLPTARKQSGTEQNKTDNLYIIEFIIFEIAG